MPNEGNAQNQTQNGEGSGNSEGSPPEPGTSNLESTDFKWGNNAPTEWQGKDAEYAIQEYNRLANGVRQYLTQMQAQGQLRPQATPGSFQPPTESKVNTDIDPDLLVTDPAEWQRRFQTNTATQFQQYLGQAIQPLFQGQAESAKALSRSDPTVKVIWDKYGQEIENMTAGVHPSYKGNKALWDSAARLVASQHLDELAAERAQELAANMAGGTEHGGTRGQGVTSVKDEVIQKLESNDYGQRLLKKYGVEKIRQQAKEMGTTLEKYADMVANTNVIMDPEKPGEWHNREVVRDANV